MRIFKTANRGFTLTELMIVVAIVGILAAIAYPSYLDSVRKARRSDARGSLMELSQFMERYFTENNTFTGAALPFNQSPKDPMYEPRYNLDVEVTANTYILEAVPIQADADCDPMTLTDTGARAPADCW